MARCSARGVHVARANGGFPASGALQACPPRPPRHPCGPRAPRARLLTSTCTVSDDSAIQADADQRGLSTASSRARG